MRDDARWLLAIALALALTALGYVGARLVPAFDPDADTAEAAAFHWRDELALSGVVLRRERLLPAPGGTAVLLCIDGQRVAAGEPLGVAAESGETFFRGWLLLRLERALEAAEGADYPLSERAFSAGCAEVREALARRSFDGAAGSAETLALRLFPEESDVPALRAEVKRTRELGDLSKNDEYRTAKREINANRSRMRYLEGMIKTARVITVDSAADEVGLFDEVEVYIPKYDKTKTVRIVTTLRNDVFTDNISKESPFGKALLGAHAGETVTVVANEKNSYEVKVISIKKGKDDDTLPISSF